MYYEIYYWVTFVFTLYVCTQTPIPHASRFEDIGSSIILSLFGFAVWPLAAIALYKMKREKNDRPSNDS